MIKPTYVPQSPPQKSDADLSRWGMDEHRRIATTLEEVSSRRVLYDNIGGNLIKLGGATPSNLAVQSGVWVPVVPDSYDVQSVRHMGAGTLPFTISIDPTDIETLPSESYSFVVNSTLTARLPTSNALMLVGVSLDGAIAMGGSQVMGTGGQHTQDVPLTTAAASFLDGVTAVSDIGLSVQASFTGTIEILTCRVVVLSVGAR